VSGRLRVKLVCGDNELDVHDWSGYVITEGGFIDSGNSIELRWQVPLSPSDGGPGVLQRLVGELRKYIHAAKQYEQENIGDPVYLAVYWPETDDIPVPCFGRGWRYKRIIDGALAEGSPSMGQGQPAIGFGSDAIPALAAILAVKQDADGEFAWRSEFRWAAQAKGHIQPVAENGICMWESSQNLVTNGDFELFTHDWTATGFTASESPERAKFGVESVLLVPSGGADSFNINFSGAAATQYTGSAWFYVPNGTDPSQIILSLWDDVSGHFVTASPTTTGEWERVVVTGTTDAASTVWKIVVRTNSNEPGEAFWVDGVQVEQKAYATPFIEPNRHLGEKWDTCANEYYSTSSRTGGECRIVRPIERGCVLPCTGTVHFWWRPGFDSGGYIPSCWLWDWRGPDNNNRIAVFYSAVGASIQLYINGGAVVVIPTSFSEGDLVAVGARWDFAADEYQLYVNGVPGTECTTSFACPELRGYDIFVGSRYDTTRQMDGSLYDLRMWGEALSDDEVEAVYNAGRGNGELPYVWGEGGAAFDTSYGVSLGVEVANHDDGDAGDTNYAEFGNIPGDLDAPAWLMVSPQDTPGSPEGYSHVIFGLRRVCASEIKSGLYTAGIEPRGCGQFIWEGEYTFTNIGWTVGAVSGTSNGSRIYTNPPAGSWGNRAGFRLLYLQDDIRVLKGQWRVYARIRTDNASAVFFRCEAGGGWLPDDNGLQCDADSDLGSSGHWELHDFGVIDIPDVLVPERLHRGVEPFSSYCSYSLTLDVEVKGTTGSETAELDYILLVPEEVSGRWSAGTSELLGYAVASVFTTDTESRYASGQMILKRDYQLSSDSGLGVSYPGLYPFRGNSVWVPSPGPSRCVVAFTTYPALVVETTHYHDISYKLYIDLRLAGRYLNSR